MPHRSEFYIYKRKKTKGSYWYVCYVDPVTGRQGNAKSIDVLKEKLGMKDLSSVRRRDEAVIIAKKALDLGLAGSGENSRMLFSDYCLSFWDWERSMYIRRRNSMKEGSIGKEYAANMYFFIKKHVVPLMPKGIRLQEVRTADLDHVINTLLVEKGLATGTVQLIVLSFSIPLKEASREGLIAGNPAEKVVKIVRTERERGAFTRDEIKRLYSYIEHRRDDLEESYRLAMKTALLTGMRSGEVRALHIEDLEATDDPAVVLVNIRHSISPYSGLKGTKGKYDRQVLIPAMLAEELWMNASDEGVVLPSVYSGYVSSPTLRDHFYRVLERIGITPEERERRNLTFHSLRHTFSTMGHEMNVSQEDRMQVLGHRSVEVNDRYTHPGLGALRRVYRISEMIAGADESAENPSS